MDVRDEHLQYVEKPRCRRMIAGCLIAIPLFVVLVWVIALFTVF
jgi:type IV secretory pathway TrbD component